MIGLLAAGLYELDQLLLVQQRLAIDGKEDVVDFEAGLVGRAILEDLVDQEALIGRQPELGSQGGLDVGNRDADPELRRRRLHRHRPECDLDPRQDLDFAGAAVAIEEQNDRLISRGLERGLEMQRGRERRIAQLQQHIILVQTRLARPVSAGRSR